MIDAVENAANRVAYVPIASLLLLVAFEAALVRFVRESHAAVASRSFLVAMLATVAAQIRSSGDSDFADYYFWVGATAIVFGLYFVSRRLAKRVGFFGDLPKGASHLAALDSAVGLLIGHVAMKYGLFQAV